MTRLAGVLHLRKASERLGPDASGGRFAEGLSLFWAATVMADSWPRELRQRAEQLNALIFREGTIKATADKAASDPPFLAELRSKLCAFLDDALKLDAGTGGAP
jgi:hypothetical protein